MGLTEDLAAWAAAPVDLSDETIGFTTQCIIDWVGVALAGAAQPECEGLVDAFVTGPLRTEAGPGSGVTVIGRRLRLPILDAVVVNGVAGHVLDFDDSQLDLEGHSSAPTLPALLALAEQRGAGGRAVLEALVVGVTVGARLSTVVNPRHYERGWHATATLGTFSAAAACGRLLGLDPGGQSRAIGLASVQAAGLKGAFGAMTKPFQVAKAAANGLMSAALAERGVTAPGDALEADQGFALTHGCEEVVPEPLELDPAEVMKRILFKYHASCHSTHPGLEALAALAAQRRGLRARDIDKLVLRIGPSVLRICNIEHPVTGLQLKFSLRGTLGLALTGIDTSDPGVYTDETARRADVLAAEEKIQVEIDPRLTYWQAELEALMADGSRLERTVDLETPSGDVAAQRPRLEEKFERLVVPVLGPGRTSELLDALTDLDGLDDVGEMLRLCAPGRGES